MLSQSVSYFVFLRHPPHRSAISPNQFLFLRTLSKDFEISSSCLSLLQEKSVFFWGPEEGLLPASLYASLILLLACSV